MSKPSSQRIAIWTVERLETDDWLLLRDVSFQAVKRHWTGKSDGEIWELIEEYLQHIAEQLRNDLAECKIDGTAVRFEIDSEANPYIRGVPSHATSLLLKLRKICPFAVEKLCADIMNKLGAESHKTQQSHDGGVDFVAHGFNIVPNAMFVPHCTKASVIGQTKRYQEANVISETKIREFVGAAAAKKHDLQITGAIQPLSPVILAFWTTSSFDPNAKKFARKMGLWYMDGYTLATYIESLGLADEVMAMPDAKS